MKSSSRREGYGSETKGRTTGEVHPVVTSRSYEQSGTFVYLSVSLIHSFIHPWLRRSAAACGLSGCGEQGPFPLIRAGFSCRQARALGYSGFSGHGAWT